MQILIHILSDVLDILGILSIIASAWLMHKVKKAIPEGMADQSLLTPKERGAVIICSILFPLINQAIFYYGWRRRLPVKAKQANNWGWLGFLIGIVLYFGLSIL